MTRRAEIMTIVLGVLALLGPPLADLYEARDRLNAAITQLEAEAEPAVPAVVNAAVGAASHELQADFPSMARLAQTTPSQIHHRLGHTVATAGVFEPEVHEALRERARTRFIALVEEYRVKHGVTPWGVYCDEIRVEPAPSFNAFELFWLARTHDEYKGVSSYELLARSDALAACYRAIQAGFHDASEQVWLTSGERVVPVQGMTPGPKQRDEATLQSFQSAAPAFAARHPDLGITWVVVWDYWGEAAIRNPQSFAVRSQRWWSSNRLAYGCPVIRVARPEVMTNKGAVLLEHDGTATPWTDEMQALWWDATPGVEVGGDPKGIWGASDGRHEASFRKTAWRVASTMLERAGG